MKKTPDQLLDQYRRLSDENVRRNTREGYTDRTFHAIREKTIRRAFFSTLEAVMNGTNKEDGTARYRTLLEMQEKSKK